MKPENKSQFVKAMKDCAEGTFSAIAGKVYGFSVENGKCTVFDTAEVDDFRQETFDTPEAALDGFKIGSKTLADYVGKVEIKPCLSV